MFQDIWQFLCALVKHWAALATGGIIMAANWAYHGATGTQQGKLEFDILAFLFFVVGAFLAWRDQYRIAQEHILNVRNLEAAAQDEGKSHRREFAGFLYRWKAHILSPNSINIGSTYYAADASLSVYQHELPDFQEHIPLVRDDFSDRQRFETMTKRVATLGDKDWQGKQPRDVICAAIDELVSYVEAEK